MFSCPDCSKEFQSQESLNRHYPQSHSGSIAKESAQCVSCGNEFQYYPSDKEGLYCSNCIDESYSVENLKHGSGEDHTQWKGGDINGSCSECGKNMTIQRSKYDNYDNHFCCTECMSKFRSKQYTGEDNPNYVDGDSENRMYGASWRKVRLSALVRDQARCQYSDCDSNGSNSQIHVHHIKPVRTFDDPNHAHEIDNLVCFCPKHHRIAEGQTERLN